MYVGPERLGIKLQFVQKVKGVTLCILEVTFAPLPVPLKEEKQDPQGSLSNCSLAGSRAAQAKIPAQSISYCWGQG